MSSSSGKEEELLSGTVEMLKPFLIRFGKEQGKFVIPSDSSICGPMYQYFDLRDIQTQIRFGNIETQQLPGERVRIIFNPAQPSIEPDAALERQRKFLFDEFVAMLLKRFVEIGFISLPEPQKPKRGIGFPS